MKNLYLAVGALAAVALVSLTACEVTDDTGAGGGDGGNTSMGGNTGTGGDGGTAPTCLSCGEYTTAVLSGDAPLVEDVCGYDTATESCDAGTSCEILSDLGDCLCQAGVCDDVCELTCGTGTSDSADCGTCQTTEIAVSCVTEFNACSLD